MNVKKMDRVPVPAYPSRRQFADGKVLLGAIIGLSGVVLAAEPSALTVGAPKTEPALATPAAKLYLVQKGDTLYGIAQKHLGAGKRWPELIQANPGLTDKNLKPGQTIRIPAVVVPPEPALGGAIAMPRST